MQYEFQRYGSLSTSEPPDRCAEELTFTPLAAHGQKLSQATQPSGQLCSAPIAPSPVGPLDTALPSGPTSKKMLIMRTDLDPPTPKLRVQSDVEEPRVQTTDDQSGVEAVARQDNDPSLEGSSEADFSSGMEVDEIDKELDPLASASLDSEFAITHALLAQIKVRRHAPFDEGEVVSRVRAVLDEMANLPENVSLEQVSEDKAFLASVSEQVHDYTKFVSGSFNHRLAAWQELLKSSTRHSSKRVLKWLREGVKPVFEGTQNAEKSKLDRVRALLRFTVPHSQVENYLQGVLPHEIEFRNHLSVQKHLLLAIETTLQNVESGAIKVYAPGEGKPKVVLPLGVAVSAGKERVILNARYANAFMKKFPFKYERLRNILLFLRKGSFITTWDLKAGYFHVEIHPKFRTYFGFKIGEVYFHSNVICFGWMQACYIFTLVMQEVFNEVRLRGIPVSSYIDDGLTGDLSRDKCRRVTVLIIKLLDVLGAYLGIPKCHLEPAQILDWLGFEVDTPQQRFRVSEKKMKKVIAAIEELLRSPEVSARQLAAVAGKLISLSPAVLPAALYTRSFFEAIKGRISWDSVFETGKDVKQSAQEWKENLPAWNGRPWYLKAVSLEASADASDFGYGGFLRFPFEKQLTVAGQLKETELDMSSTARELLGILALLQVASQQVPELIRNACVQVTCDNQAAVLALTQFRSKSPEVNSVLRDIFDVCLATNCQVVGLWKPREAMELEDHLSRFPDSSDWGISASEFNRVCSVFKVVPDLDLFASDRWHVCEKFVSLNYTKGCFAVQALQLDWSSLVASRAYVWIFPPVRHLQEVIERLATYRVNSVLIVPYQPATNWWLALQQLPLKYPLSIIDIPRVTDCCIPSRRVPAKTANPALFHLKAFKVVWN